MLFALLFAIFTSFTWANISYNNACSKKLAGVTYSVDGPRKEYLQKISRELNYIADIMNTDLGPSAVERFTNKYKTVVAIIDAFGNINVYAFGRLVRTGISRGTFGIFSSLDARAVMNLGAYANENRSEVYSFLSFSREGIVYQVTVGRPNIDLTVQSFAQILFQ